MTAEGAVDWGVLRLLAEEMGDPGIVEELVAIYLAELPARTRALTDAGAHDDAEALRSAAHALKASSATVGALGLQALCRDIESAAAHGDVGAAQELARGAGAQCEAVGAALAAGPA